MTLPSQAAGQRFRVGVIGVGYLGSRHARVYAAMPDVELVGVADVVPSTARSVAEQNGCAAFTDATELLGRVDAVSVAVPVSSHLPAARPFLEHGIHMLMEKPLAPTLDDSLELVELAERAGVIFQVGHSERFNAGVIALTAHAPDPRFIEVHRLGPFVARGTDIDVVMDLMIHDIDIILALVKAPLKTVVATGIPVVTPHVDIANARLEFENGAVANVTASRVSTRKFRRIRVFGDACYYGLDCIAQTLEMSYAEKKADGEWPTIVSRTVDIEPRPPLDTELEQFIHSVRSGRPPLVDGRAGLEALRVALLVKEAIHACPT